MCCKEPRILLGWDAVVFNGSMLSVARDAVSAPPEYRARRTVYRLEFSSRPVVIAQYIAGKSA